MRERSGRKSRCERVQVSWSGCQAVSCGVYSRKDYDDLYHRGYRRQPDFGERLPSVLRCDDRTSTELTAVSPKPVTPPSPSLFHPLMCEVPVSGPRKGCPNCITQISFVSPPHLR